MTRPALLLLCLAVLGAACGYDEVPGASDDNGTQVPQEETLTFLPQTPLQLEPGATAVLAVQVKPARSVRVLFGIIGDAKNEAFLSAESARTDAQGTAYVSLTAPKSPGALTVRAAIKNGPTAERSVSVSGQGFATLLVTPAYTGTRDPKDWVASAWPDLLCANLIPDYPKGPTSARGSSPLSLGPLPVGPAYAIVVRSGNLAAGCLDVTTLVADTVRPISVNVTDLPVVPSSALGAVLTFAEVDHLFIARLRQLVAQRLEAMGPDQDESSLLVEAMLGVLPSRERRKMAEHRERIEATVAEFLGAEGWLHAVFEDEYAQAALSIEGGPPLVGTLEPHAEPAKFNVVAAANVLAEAAGFETDAPWTMTTDAGDSFALSGEITFAPVRWLSGITRALSSRDPSTRRGRLSEKLSCDGLASRFAKSELYPGCDEACALSLCEEGLEHLWDKTAEADSARMTLKIAIGGTVKSAPSGALLELQGNYIGSVEKDGTLLRGAFRATAPE